MQADFLSRSYRHILRPALLHRWDPLTPVCIGILGLIGVVFIHSAQVYHGGGLWMRQLIWLGLGAVAYIGVARIDYKIMLGWSHWIYLAGLLLLLAVHTPLGVSMFGAKRWINLGFMYFQPTELAKIGTLVMLASILARHRLGDLSDSFAVLAKTAVVFILPILLIFSQPDLGSTLVFPPMVFALLYVSRLSERFFITAFAVFSVLVGIVGFDVYRYYSYLDERNHSPQVESTPYERISPLPIRDYQRDRVLSFVAPELVDPQGIGVAWNAIQARISVATGGVTGKGIGKGTQAQLGYLPQSVAHNDFIFAVIAEETGFLGSVFVIGLFGVILGNGIRIAGKARDQFGMLLAIGVSVIFLVHVFINIGMTVGITPITGLPLPFLSYGGSFVLSCCILQGLVQSVYRFRKDYTV